MRVVCAWCGMDIRDETRSGSEDDIISHGICNDCKSNLSAQKGMPLQEFVDSMHVPVVLVDSKVVIVGANAAAASYFHTRLSRIEGVKPGDLFECEFARLPGGCGRTIHCNGCVIRRTVKETSLTGESRVNVTACLNRKTRGMPFQEKLSITTVKAGDAVLLKIENLPAEK